MTFDIDLVIERSGFVLSAQVSGDSRRIGLFGPSGAGKTTLVRALAGLEHGRGRIVFDEQVWQNDQPQVVITSYSIHYTKLYEKKRASSFAARPSCINSC